MIIHGSKSISNIEGINPDYLKLVTIVEDDTVKWAIRDRNKQQTPFFTNGFNCYVYNDRSLMFIGETEDRRDIYCVVGYKNKDEKFLFRADTDGDLIYLQNLNDRLFIAKTDRGSYLFDALLFQRKSDLFDSIFTLENRLVFRKNFVHSDKTFTFYGELRLDGTLKRNIYDETDDVNFMTPKATDPSGDFEIIDEFALEEKIEEIEKKTGKKVMSKVLTLFKLNLEEDKDV